MAKKSAEEEAVRYLEHRMRTVSEMRGHLRDRGYTDEETQNAVSELIRLRYLDDLQYAASYMEYAFGKKRGISRIRRELEERGVDPETIDIAYEDHVFENHTDEYSTALSIARREIFGTDEPDDEMCRSVEIDDRSAARIARKLQQLGYRTDDIYRVLGEMRTWTDTEEQ